MSEAVLSLRGIVKIYNKGSANEIRVLDGVDMDVQPGEVVGLVAPSGAGKSTLLHIAGLLDMPDSGTLFVCGASAVGSSDRVRTRIRRGKIGFVYQFHHLLPEFSALENVLLPQLFDGVRRSEATAGSRRLLESVGLSERADHRPAEMSGGEQQRTAVCRALANNPRILLADEPTGNLDSKTSDHVFDMMLGIARTSGLAAVIATHNSRLADRMDRTVRLEQGRIYEND